MSTTLAPSSLAGTLGEDWRRPGRSAQALAEALRALVVDGRVAVRTRVPSERALAPELGVSRGTVSRAYDRLREDGFLVSARGAGSWLTLPDDSGPAPRAAIARRFSERGVDTTPDQVLVTAGAQHALHLVLRLLCAPGDRVLVDAPAYPRTLAAVRGVRARPVAVPLEPEGWDAGAWEQTLAAAAPRLAVTMPDHHNPTGLTMGDAQRRAIVSACARAGVLLVADETSAELRLDGPPRRRPLAAFDPGGGVVTLGSMSKAAWGGLRLGWIRANPRLIRELAAVRADVDMASPVLEQLLALELLARWDEVVDSRVALLRERREALLDALAEHAPAWRVRRPSGGLSAWVRLPTPAATRLASAAAREGLIVTPGPAFSVDGTFERHLRLPFTAAPEVLRDAVRTLAGLAPRLGAEVAEHSEPIERAV